MLLGFRTVVILCRVFALTLHTSYRIIISSVIETASVNVSIRMDSELKAQAEQAFAQLGMNMTGTINLPLLQIARDRAVPLSLSLSSEQSLYADLLRARTERAQGSQGHTAENMLSEIDQIIADAEGQGGIPMWMESLSR